VADVSITVGLDGAGQVVSAEKAMERATKALANTIDYTSGSMAKINAQMMQNVRAVKSVGTAQAATNNRMKAFGEQLKKNTTDWRYGAKFMKRPLAPGLEKGLAGQTDAMQSASMGTEVLTHMFPALGSKALMAAGAIGVAVGAVYAIGRAAMAVAGAVARLAGAFLSAVAGAVSFAESLSFSLGKFLGSAVKAKKAISDIMDLSFKLGMSFEEAGATFKEMVSAGFTAEQAKKMVAFRADVTALGDGTQESAQRIAEAFKQLGKAVASGKIEADGFDSILQQLPVNRIQVMTQMAKLMGKSLEEVMALPISKLPVDKLAEAFQKATLAATGFSELGDAAIDKMKKTVSGSWQAIQATFGNWIKLIGVKLAPLLQNKLLPALNQILDWMRKPETLGTMGKIAEGMGAAVDKAIELADRLKPVFDILSGADKPISMGEALGTEESSIERMGTLLSAFASGIMDVLVPAMKGLAIVATTISEAFGGDKVGTMEAMVGAARILGGVFAVVAGAVLMVVGVLAGLFALLIGIPLALVVLAVKVVMLGKSLADGLAKGILDGGAAVVSAMKDVVSRAIAAAKALIKPGSPSKVFAELGFSVSTGLAAGVEGGQSRVSAAMAGMVNPADIAAAASGGGATNHYSAAPSASISISGAQSPEATAAAVREVILDQLVGAFETLNIQVAGGG